MLSLAPCQFLIRGEKCIISSIDSLICTKGEWTLCKGYSPSSRGLTHLCLRSLHHRFVAWTKPDTTPLLLLTLTDLARSKSELIAENALLRQQLIILRRQVKRPACTKTDRILLVFLARMVGPGSKHTSSSSQRRYCGGIARAFKLSLEI